MKTIKSLAAGLLAATLTAAAGFSTPAQAGTQPSATTVAIPYGDLDLATEGGRAALDSRIRQAVRDACGEPSPADLRALNGADACRTELTASLAQHRDALYAARRQVQVLAASR